MPILEWLAYGCLTAVIFDVVWWVKTTPSQKHDYRSEVFQAVAVATVMLIALGAVGFLGMIVTVPMWALYFVLKKLNRVRMTMHSH